MCGLFGIVSKNLKKNYYSQNLSILSHRGPDDQGFFEDDNVFLGQRRLAIIDLSPIANQPMFLNCPKSKRKLSLIFNGEIYNYKELKKELQNLGHNFFSNSDTEVILHSYEEWGINSFQKFRGMFACALYDLDKKELLLFRDRFGIKPLYYYFDEKNFAFSSEIKAFWNLDFIKKEINKKSIVDFLKLGYILQPETFFKNIFALEPGSVLLVKLENEKFSLTKQKFADIFDYYLLEKENISLENSILKAKETLIDSIFYHLVADVEVGLFLSGGIDSTILLYLMRELEHQKIKTVSAIFPDTPYDESYKINELIKIFSPEHQELKISGKDFLENLENIFYFMDQPTIDGVNTYFVSLAAKKAELKVVLSGLGGDELFYGYPSFFDLPKFRKIKKVLKLLQFEKIFQLENFIFNPKLSKLSELIKADNLFEEYLIYRSVFTENQIKNILIPEVLDTLEFNKIADENYGRIKDILSQISYFEINYYLRNQLLRDSDVFSMAHSIELRVPFVDNILFEKIIPIPDEYKIKDKISKFLLKEIIKDKVSEKIIYQKKQGFVLPIEIWLKNEARNIIKEELLKSQIYKREKIEKLLNLFFNNKLHWSRIWSLFVLNRFLKSR